MSSRQIVDPTKIDDVQNRRDIYDNMISGFIIGEYKIASSISQQELADQELAKLLDRQLNTSVESQESIFRDEEIARSLDRKLNETSDLSRDEVFARSLDRKSNISACTSEENTPSSSVLDHVTTPDLLINQWLDRVKRRGNGPHCE